MSVELKNSETLKNLMRAFAGESQARNRYTFAASLCKKQKLQVLANVFTFTAGQEEQHAEIFYDLMKDVSGETVQIDGGYPADTTNDILQLLRRAQHNEFEEHDPVYPAFAETAKKEGFPQIAAKFQKIAEIEESHGKRFGYMADLLEQGRLFSEDSAQPWMCLNCGYIFEGTQAPKNCPVCDHDQGYFIRLSMAPYGSGAVVCR